MYGQALRKAGFEVTMKLDAGARTAYVPALERGDLDLVPDYLAPVTDYLRAGVPVDAPRRRPPAATSNTPRTCSTSCSRTSRWG